MKCIAQGPYYEVPVLFWGRRIKHEKLRSTTNECCRLQVLYILGSRDRPQYQDIFLTYSVAAAKRQRTAKPMTVP
jgi:hypothetical protein